MRSFKLGLCALLMLASSASAQLSLTGAGSVAGGGPVDCANPTNGAIDLSVCSNLIYAALVL